MARSKDAPGDGNGLGDRGRGRLNSQRDLWYSGRSSRIAPIYQRSCLSAHRYAASVTFLDNARHPLNYAALLRCGRSTLTLIFRGNGSAAIEGNGQKSRSPLARKCQPPIADIA